MKMGDHVFRHLKVKGFNPVIQALDILYRSRYFSIVLDKDYFSVDGKFVESSIVEIVTEPYAQDHVHGSLMPGRKEVEARIAKIVEFYNSHIKSQTRFSLQDLKDDYNVSCTSDADKLTDGHLMPLLEDSANCISPSDLMIETRGESFAYPGPDLGQTALHSKMLDTIKAGNFDPEELSACIHPQITLSLELDCHYTWHYPEALQMEEKMWMLKEAVRRINRLLNACPDTLDITPNIEYGLITCTLFCISAVAMKQSTAFASLPQDATFLLSRNILHDIKNQVFTRREKQQLEAFYTDHSSTIKTVLGEENYIFERKYDPVTDLFAKDGDEDWNRMRALFRITFEKTICKLQKISTDQYAPLVELRRLPNCTGAEIFDPSGFWEKQHQEIADFQQGRYRVGSLLAVPGAGV